MLYFSILYILFNKGLTLQAILRQIIFVTALMILGSCHSDDNITNAYRQIGANFNENFKLTGSDLIVTYDLGLLDNTNCIYAVDLGLIINDEDYRQNYIDKFENKFKATSNLRREAVNKIVRISKVLNTLHLRHKILSHNEHQYVQRLSKADLTKIDPRYELSKLDKIMKNIPIMLPEYNATVSSHYGARKHPVTRKSTFHTGIDLYGKAAAPVYSSAEGKVIFAGRQNGYGNVVEIIHGRGIKTKYAHLKNISVKRGQVLSRGYLIGHQGRSGNVTNEHLHYEIWVNGDHVNPYDFIGCECRCNKKKK